MEYGRLENYEQLNYKYNRIKNKNEVLQMQADEYNRKINAQFNAYVYKMSHINRCPLKNKYANLLEKTMCRKPTSASEIFGSH